MNQSIAHLVRDTPPAVWAPLSLLALILMIRLALLFRHKSTKLQLSHAENAERIAEQKWRFLQRKLGKSRTIVYLEGTIEPFEYFSLIVGEAHCDKERFNDLFHGDVIEFDFLQKPMTGSAGAEVAPYLRIKKVYKVN